MSSRPATTPPIKVMVPLTSSIAVSYTHLDVYKRQPLSPTPNCNSLHSTTTGTVSYTHLDVYKRQARQVGLEAAVVKHWLENALAIFFNHDRGNVIQDQEPQLGKLLQKHEVSMLVVVDGGVVAVYNVLSSQRLVR